MGPVSHIMTPAKKWVWVLNMDLIAIPRHKRQVIKSKLKSHLTWKKFKVKSDFIFEFFKFKDLAHLSGHTQNPFFHTRETH